MNAAFLRRACVLTTLFFAAAAGAQQPDIASWRPRVAPVSAADIERVGAAGKLPTDCFWNATLSRETFNILLPDTAVTYWVAQYRLPAGARLALQGEFAHARHQSLTSYNADGQPVDRLNDLMTRPDTGASNPYVAGAAREAPLRSYSVDVVEAGMGQVNVSDGRSPANRLFAQASNGVQQLYYRVYLPDQGRNPAGGAPLPRPVLMLADGSRMTGEALCKQISLKEGALRDIRLPADTVHQMYAIAGATSPVHPAQNPLRWNAFYNAALSATNVLQDTPSEALRAKQDTTRRNGFYGTLDNTYMSAYIDDRLGQVLVLRGKAPLTPHTHGGAATMQAAQLRYWSLCKYRSLADTAVDSCLYDEQVALDAQSRYTIVISKAGNRPRNADIACGVTWLDWGDAGDGIGNPSGGFLVMRQMMPSAEFYPHSLFATVKPGDEAAVLGDYFSKSTYMSRAEFEQLGCSNKQ